MAQSRDVRIEVKQAGFELVEQLRAKIKALMGDLREAQQSIGVPLQTLADTFKELGKSVENIKEFIGSLEGVVSKVVE